MASGGRQATALTGRTEKEDSGWVPANRVISKATTPVYRVSGDGAWYYLDHPGLPGQRGQFGRSRPSSTSPGRRSRTGGRCARPTSWTGSSPSSGAGRGSRAWACACSSRTRPSRWRRTRTSYSSCCSTWCSTPWTPCPAGAAWRSTCARPATAASSCTSATPARGSPRRCCPGCSRRSSAARRPGWGWACRCRGASPRTTAAPSPPITSPAEVPASCSACRPWRRRDGRMLPFQTGLVALRERIMPTLLVVDDEPSILYFFRQAFAGPEVTLRTACSAAEGVEAVTRERPDVVILDICLPDASGLETFRHLHRLDPKVPVLFITGHGTMATAIEAMRLGAYEYLLKPLELDQLTDLVERAFAISRLMRTTAVLPEGRQAREDADAVVGRCPAMQAVYKAIGRVAGQDVTVLIRGESGTGKELVARAIYHYSNRAQGPFLAINCA